MSDMAKYMLSFFSFQKLAVQFLKCFFLNVN